MTNDLPPLEPPPREKRAWPIGWLFFPVAVLVALYIGPLRLEVRFLDDAGHVPGPFEVILKSGATEKQTLVEKGHLIRGRWDELEITDDSYLRATHPVRGGKMRVAIERNDLLKLRHASSGQSSVPQRGDPNPQDD